jgi:hypothetical protein
MTSEQAPRSNTRRRAGRKPYPTMTFERVLDLPKAINEYGVEERIRRLTLFEHMGRSPGSSSTRTLITTSARYGLTTGSYQSEFLELTEAGKHIATEDHRNNAATLRMVYNQAIAITPAFDSVFNRLENGRKRSLQVLQDLLAQEDIDEADCEEAATVFIDNIRYIGLIREQSGSDYIIPLEQLLEELPGAAEDESEAVSVETTQEPVEEQRREQPTLHTPAVRSVVGQPALHIDIQIHIDSSATAEQVDQIFASMAKHLYGREG